MAQVPDILVENTWGLGCFLRSMASNVESINRWLKDNPQEPCHWTVQNPEGKTLQVSHICIVQDLELVCDCHFFDFAGWEDDLESFQQWSQATRCHRGSLWWLCRNNLSAEDFSKAASLVGYLMAKTIRHLAPAEKCIYIACVLHLFLEFPVENDLFRR